MKKFYNIFLIIISTFLSFLSLELILRYSGYQNFVLYEPSNYYGYYQKGNQNVIRNGKIVKTDSNGNRNDINNNFKNSELLFLGDSITYGGSKIDNKELFTYLVSKNLDKKHLNISSNGWGIENIVSYLEFYNLYKPNTTYILTCINDCYTRNLRRIEQNYFFINKNFFALDYAFSYFLFQFDNMIRNQTKYLKKNPKRIEFLNKDNIRTIEKSVNSVIRVNNVLDRINSKLIVIHSPYKKNFKKKITQLEKYEDNYKKIILDLLEKNNIKYFDIIDFFSEEETIKFGKFFSDKVHLTKDGHKLYSRVITKILDEQIR